MIDKNYWKITEFSQLVGKSLQTVDKWFRDMEKRGIHYIQRVEAGEGEEKVYDDLDLKIGHYVVTQREKKWSLDAIFEALSDEFDLRPFPEGKQPQSQLIDVEAMKKEIAIAFEELASATITNLREEVREEIRAELRRERQIETELREEALRLWDQKPGSEKMRKIGWFQKVEDWDKRDQFVQGYIDKHYEERIKKIDKLE